MLLADKVDEGRVAVQFTNVLDAEVVVDDVIGLEKLVDATEVGKERDVLEDATAQNCWTMLSTRGSSCLNPECEMQAMRAFSKSVALEVSASGLCKGTPRIPRVR